MIKLLAILAAIVCLVLPARAQVPSGALSRSAIQTNIANDFPDNVTGAIAPVAMRTFMTQFIDSTLIWLNDYVPITSLQYDSTTINGTVCTLGGTCTVAASGSLIVGSSSITGGTTGYFLYDNAGTLGNVGVTGSGLVVLNSTPSIANLTVTSSFSAQGLVTDTDIATQPSNTILGNATSGTASPSPLSISSCSAATSALTWVFDVGYGCNTAITAAAISATGVTAGALTSAVTVNNTNWSGTQLGVANGGTGLTAGTSGGIPAFTAAGTITSSGALTLNMPVIGGGVGAVPTVGTISGNTTKFATFSGAATSGNCVSIDASGNLVAAGGACTTGGGGGTVTSSTAGQIAWYASTAATVIGNVNLTISSGALTVGLAGSTIGTVALSGNTSGATILTPLAAASGTLTVPSATDQLIARATTDTLTNKTYDTAGTGNVFKINGTQISAVTGTGAAVLATGPTLSAPVIGAATGTSLVTSNGFVATGAFGGSFSAGIAMDYSSVNGRFSNDSATGTFGWYNNGLANTALATLSSAGVFSPTGGIAGVTSGTGAASGIVGEVISSSIAVASAVSLTTTTPKNVTSVSLTAGDWNCWANMQTYPAAGTYEQFITGGLSTSTGAFATNPGGGQGVSQVGAAGLAAVPPTAAAGVGIGVSIGQEQFDVSGATTVYLVAESQFTTSTNKAGGFLGCRRMR